MVPGEVEGVGRGPLLEDIFGNRHDGPKVKAVFYLDSGIDNKYSAVVVTHAEQFYQHVDTVHTRKSTAAETEPSWILLRHPFNRPRQPLFRRSPDDGPFKSDAVVIQERTKLQDVNRARRGRIGAV